LIDLDLNVSEDSEDEDILVRVGDIPLKWYDGYSHIGYNIDG